MTFDPRFGAFFMLTGVTFTAFASGFGVCLFNLDTVGACVEAAENWLMIFRQMGDHIVAWGIAIVQTVFQY
jgi:hypothetical protein